MIHPPAGRVALLLLAVAACAPTETNSGGAPAPVVESVSGPALPFAGPDEVGLSAEALDRIAPSMQAFVDDGRIPGAVTLVARSGSIVHWEAVGARSLEDGTPLRPDDIFRIFSMTKPITSAAIMMLVERGDLALDDPVSSYIPGFAEVSVLAEDGSRTPADAPITIRHLLSHTGGLTYGLFGSTPADQAYQASGLFGASSLEEFVDTVTGLPLVDDPGDRWTYSVSTDVLGYVVQLVSGQPFEDFLAENIFEPLGMDDTAFWVPPEKRDRFTTRYADGPDGLTAVDRPHDGDYAAIPPFASGGGGLVSTASDYVRFAQMILQGGELEGVRILRPETVREMSTSTLSDDLVPIRLRDWFPPAYGFGLGFATLLDADATPAPTDSEGLIRWGGIANTFFWIDPAAELIAMVWTQLDPFLAHDLEKAFEELVYAALEAPPQ